MSTTPNGNHNFTEAPASLTLKISYRGFSDVLFTLRADSGLELLGKLDAVIDKLEAIGATPGQRGHGPAPVGNGGGRMCPDGHGPMKESTKKPGEYYCPAVVGTHPQTGKKLYCTHKSK